MRGGFFWVLFLAVEKEYLARGAKTAMPNKSTPVNIKQRKPKKTPAHIRMKPRGQKNLPTLQNQSATKKAATDKQ